MIKLLVINFAFQKPEFFTRWRLLAGSHADFDVTLLAPYKWEWGKQKALTYGKVDNVNGVAIKEERFRIRLIRTKNEPLGDWSSPDFEREILSLSPDLIYYIGGYTAVPLMQILKIKKKHKLNCKVCAFSMRGHSKTIEVKKEDPFLKRYVNYVGKRLILAPRLKTFNAECDAAFCHYPAALKAFKEEGFTKPVYMQTQVGVNPDIFFFNETSRKEIREKYCVGDAYLFGSASRFHYSKGLAQVISALPKEGNWKYLIMGWGTDEEVAKIKAQIAERGLEDKIILTGFIEGWENMAKYWCAIDCAIHFPLTTAHWEETFSLALVQAMITGLPVIGSDSGSVPYQLGDDGIIVPEGDVSALSTQIRYMLDNPEYGVEVGKKMRRRAYDCFNIYHLNDLFCETVKDILNGVFDQTKVDMAKWKVSES